jgi:hypothetical protein
MRGRSVPGRTSATGETPGSGEQWARPRRAVPVDRRAPHFAECASLRSRTSRLALPVGGALAALAAGVNSAEDQDGQDGYGDDPEENREVS